MAQAQADFAPKHTRRPVLYNGDGYWFYYTFGGLHEHFTREFLEHLSDRLADAGVSIHSEVFYDAGWCNYDTGIGERIYAGANGFEPRMVADLHRLIAEGHEPLNVFIENAHKRGMRFLACLRMNDRHSMNVQNPPVLIKRHPDIAMKSADGSVIGGMDFRYPEVRDFLFHPMEELVTQYDVDGLELDWMRWAQMFSEDIPIEMRISGLNDYHRRIRAMLDVVGQRKGRRLLLSVRVPATLDECHHLGYDPATYIREGLIDILCPSDFLFLDPHMPVREFAGLTKDSGVLLLPSLHASPGWHCGYARTENERALAHSYYQQGADGISVFNWFTPHEMHQPEDFRALEEIGDPSVLVRLPREYLFNPIWGGRESPTGRVIDQTASLPRTALHQREAFPLYLTEDCIMVKVCLELKIENLEEDDEIQIDVNGQPLEPCQFKREYVPYGKPEAARYLDAAWWAGAHYLYRIEDAGTLLKDGTNEIGITLLNTQLISETRITLYEVCVTVQAQP